MAWNSTNSNLLAAGYGSRPAADTPGAAGAPAGAAGGGTAGPAGMGLSGAAAEAGAGNSVFAQGGLQGSMVGQGALSAPRGSGAEGGAGGGAAEGDAAAGGGCVALWSLKNQFYPVWSFSTKSGEHKGCCRDFDCAALLMVDCSTRYRAVVSFLMQRSTECSHTRSCTICPGQNSTGQILAMQSKG